MLSTQTIIEILSKDGTGVKRGGLLFKQRQLRQTRYQDAQPTHEQLLDELLAQPERRPEVHVHPADRARLEPGSVDPASRGRVQKALEPADLEFLRRLPEPSRMTFDDAVQVARFAAQTPQHTADGRLVQSIWEPVKALHDRLAADAEVRNARAPMSPVPEHAARAALIDAIASETTDLTPAECGDRARRLLREVAETRAAAHVARLASAENRVQELIEQRRRRESPVAVEA